MTTSLACEALKSGRRLALQYDGTPRVVEVHAVGITKDENTIMRVWQVRGASESGKPVDWKLMRFDKVSAAKIIDEASEAPRAGYKKGDPAMKRIICEV